MKKCLLMLLALGVSFAAAQEQGATVTDRRGIVLVDGRNYPFQSLAAHVLTGIEPARKGAGKALKLTLDARLQYATEKALRKVGRGAALVVDPRTGELLAMASVPSFDPDDLDRPALAADGTDPLVNRCISAYAPGATFLVVTALAGARHGLVDRRFACNGGVSYGDQLMKCWIASKGGAHGEMSLEKALVDSCGPFFFQLGNAAGIEEIIQVGEMLGLGERSELGLAGESAGVLPGPEWLKRAGLRGVWSDGYTANVSVGQGYVLTTPLQLTMVAAAIADGTARQPRLLMSEPTRTRAKLAEEGIPEYALDVIRNGMLRTVENGTARRASVEGIRVGGRTGTAQFMRHGQKDNHTWFIGFAPFDAPEVAVCVFVQGAKAGGVIAASLAARILEAALNPSDEIAALPPAAGSLEQIDSLTNPAEE